MPDDHYTALLSPPDSPYKRRLSDSSGGSDTNLWHVERRKKNKSWIGSKKENHLCYAKTKKPSHGVNLLIAAANYLENSETNNSMNCSTYFAESKNEFANLVMLADVACKRIESERGSQT